MSAQLGVHTRTESDRVCRGVWRQGSSGRLGISSSCQHFLPLRLHFLALEIGACPNVGSDLENWIFPTGFIDYVPHFLELEAPKSWASEDRIPDHSEGGYANRLCLPAAVRSPLIDCSLLT